MLHYPLNCVYIAMFYLLADDETVESFLQFHTVLPNSSLKVL